MADSERSAMMLALVGMVLLAYWQRDVTDPLADGREQMETAKLFEFYREMKRRDRARMSGEALVYAYQEYSSVPRNAAGTGTDF
jgi:hypothetical protein